MTDEIQKIEYLLAAKLRKLLGEDVEEIQRRDNGRSDSVADVQPVISDGIIQPVQDVTRCKPKRRRQKSSADTTSNRPKNKPTNQKRVKEPSSGCNTGMVNLPQGST